jgi:hypothetical protein
MTSDRNLGGTDNLALFPRNHKLTIEQGDKSRSSTQIRDSANFENATGFA